MPTPIRLFSEIMLLFFFLKYFKEDNWLFLNWCYFAPFWRTKFFTLFSIIYQLFPKTEFFVSADTSTVEF